MRFGPKNLTFLPEQGTVFVRLVNSKPVRPTSAPVRVLIADDHRLFGQALEAVLTADERIKVVGYAHDGREAVELERELDPDVTLMDISMPVMDGIEATRAIREVKPSARVLMLTGSNSRADVDRARDAGAAAYVTKDRIASELIETIIETASR
jgi:two-component system NarL family response regulator